jgi:hypothetical protein
MAEVEPPEGLSARKLVLETGKFNVITAYSVQEALDTLAIFPEVDAVVLHSSICQVEVCEQIIGYVKEADPEMLVIALSPNAHTRHKGADYNLSSHEPQELLNLLRSRFGDPRTVQENPRQQRRA